MRNTTPLFPGFYLPTLRKKPRSAVKIMQDKMAELKQKSLSELDQIVGQFIPNKSLATTSIGDPTKRLCYFIDDASPMAALCSIF